MTRTRKLQNYFWFAVLLHLLLFLSFTVELAFPIASEKSEGEKPLPAYFYHDDKPRPTPTVMPDDSKPPAETAQPAAEPEKQIEISADGTFREVTQPQQVQQKTTEYKQTKSYSTSVPSGAINLKSEKQIDQPLLRILSIATAAKLFYPKAAADFRITGTTQIRFLLSPDGELSDITLIQSSGTGVIDKAALATMNAISPVKGVDLYLKEARYLTVELIYD